SLLKWNPKLDILFIINGDSTILFISGTNKAFISAIIKSGNILFLSELTTFNISSVPINELKIGLFFFSRMPFDTIAVYIGFAILGQFLSGLLKGILLIAYLLQGTSSLFKLFTLAHWSIALLKV